MQAQNFQARLNHVPFITRHTLPTFMKNELADTITLQEQAATQKHWRNSLRTYAATTHNLSHARSHQGVAYDSHGEEEEAFGKN